MPEHLPVHRAAQQIAGTSCVQGTRCWVLPGRKKPDTSPSTWGACCTRVRKIPRAEGQGPAQLTCPGPGVSATDGASGSGLLLVMGAPSSTVMLLFEKRLPCLALCSAFSLCNAPNAVMNIIKYLLPRTCAQGSLDWSKLNKLYSIFSKNPIKKMCFPSQRCCQPKNLTLYSQDRSLIVFQSKFDYNNLNLFSTSPTEPFIFFFNWAKIIPSSKKFKKCFWYWDNLNSFQQRLQTRSKCFLYSCSFWTPVFLEVTSTKSVGLSRECFI